jgi:hypothetical protein
MMNKQTFTSFLKAETLVLQIKMERLAGSSENLVVKATRIAEAFSEFQEKTLNALELVDQPELKLGGDLDSNAIITDRTEVQENPVMTITEKVESIEGPVS